MSLLNNRIFPRSFRSSLKVFFLAAAAACLALVTFGCSDTTERTNSFDIGTGPITTKTKDPISREAVEKLVTRKLGDVGIAGQPVIRSLALAPEPGGVYVSIDLNRTASCHPGQLVGTAVTMAQQVMSAVFLYPDVGRMQLTLYGPTEDAKDKDTMAVRIMVNRESASKIDWFQFRDATVETLATEFWVEPTIYANWKQYGGAAITDAQQQAAANAAAATPAPTTAPAP